MVGRVMGLLIVAAGLAACGPSVVDEMPDAQTSSGSTGDSDGASPDGSGGMAESGDTTGDAMGDDCSGPGETVVEIGELELLDEIGLGRMQVYDFDADGLSDLVGTAGVIALQRDEGFELTPSPESIESASCRAGRFDGDEVPDLVCRSGAHLRVYVGGTAEATVDTPLADVTSLEPGDMNGDGIDDLVVGIDNGRRIESWKGTASGVFELTASTSWPGLAHGTFAALEPPRVDLVVTDTTDVHVLTGDGTGAFTAADSVAAPSSGFVERVSGLSGDAVLMSWAWTQLETYSGVGLVSHGPGGELVGRAYDLSPRTPLGFPAAGDIGEDGSLEVVTAVENADGVTLEAGCPCTHFVDGRAAHVFEKCAAMPLDHAPTALALLPSDSGTRLVLSTAADGTWIASIGVLGHPLPKG
jgi:hypothetical protein